MYAIVDIAGQQFKVEKGKKIFVHRLDNKEGAKVDFDQVLLIDQDGKNVIIGEPFINGALVTGKVLEHPRGDKVNVFKKKRRKGYKVKTGHRQDFTQIMIETIVEKGAKKKTVAPRTASRPQEPKASTTENVKTAPKVEKPAASKKTGTEVVDSRKVSAAKAPAKKVATATKPVVKKVTAAKPVAKKTTVKKASTAKPAAKKAPVKRAAAAKPTPKKGTEKKK